MRGAALVAALLAGMVGGQPAFGAAQTQTSVFERGQAVYYDGRQDARTPLTAAHRTLPLGSWVRVTHARTGRSVIVLINDRGPFGHAARMIDVSRPAAALKILSKGVAPVTLTLLSSP